MRTSSALLDLRRSEEETLLADCRRGWCPGSQAVKRTAATRIAMHTLRTATYLFREYTNSFFVIANFPRLFWRETRTDTQRID